MVHFFFFKHKTAYEVRISDWSSDVCSSDLIGWPGEARVEVGDRAVGGARGRRRLGIGADAGEYVFRRRDVVLGAAVDALDLVGARRDLDLLRDHGAIRRGDLQRRLFRPVRSDERLVGKEGVRRGRVWWSQV